MTDTGNTPDTGGQAPPPPPAPPAPAPQTTKPSWYENVAIVIIALFCCAPLGLIFVWLNKSWTNKTKTIITAVIIGLAVVGAIIGAVSGGSSSTDASAPATTAGNSSQATTTSRDSQSTTSSMAPATTTSNAPTTTAAPKNSASMSKAEFDQIQNGMTYAQVVEIVGSDGELLSEVGSPGSQFFTQMYKWDGSGGLGANANVLFQSGGVQSKAQFGLK